MNRENRTRYAIVIALSTLSFACAAQTQPKPAQNGQQDAKQNSTPAQKQNHVQSEGERVFKENCARCHNPPDGFSPRISGTVAMHMRVRAALSEHDMQELIRFFNP